MNSIKIDLNLIEQPDQWLPKNWQTKKLVIITDDTVNEIYGKNLLEILKSANPLLITMPPGESSKDYLVKHELEEKMIAQGCHRDSIILAFGGGVVGDMAGFIAATYMRGIDYIQIPTTLLAMVDSSIGGKTAINSPQGKNLIGAFWQPILTLIDMSFLNTLSQTQLINGLIEALKMFMTNDHENFEFVNNNIALILNKDFRVLKKVIEQAIKIKVGIVSADEKENHQRMILNFGHTIGHALEKVTDYALLHGYAVALGILVESKISQLLGYLSREDYETIKSLLLKLSISGSQLNKINIDEIIQTTKSDKKTKNDKVRYVLLEKIGQVYYQENKFAHPVSDEIVKQAFNEVSEG